MSVLVIDDSRTTRKVLRRVLQEAGFTDIVEAGDGAEALVALDALQDPTLVLVDWNMPVMNGIEFVRAARADARFDAVPLMMVTTECEPAAIAEALGAGANEFLMKPFQTEDLRQKLTLLGLEAA